MLHHTIDGDPGEKAIFGANFNRSRSIRWLRAYAALDHHSSKRSKSAQRLKRAVWRNEAYGCQPTTHHP